MDWIDASYVALAGIVGAVARALRRGLPEGWRLRLEARPAEDLPPRGWIWIHAVSVGELLLADGLVGALREEGHRLHITTGTPAGLALLELRLAGWDQGSGRVSGGAFPFDDPAGLRPFLNPSPGLFLALETELWPNLLRELESRGIPRAVVNGRLTDRSLRHGGPWMRRAASRLNVVAARDADSAKAFLQLGAQDVHVTGNLKADLPPPPSLSSRWDALTQGWADDPIVVAGNTIEGEETLALQVWAAARESCPTLRLILAPRQPRRFESVAQSLEGRAFVRASAAWPTQAEPWKDIDVLLLDSLGELSRVWSLGTLALVGGGWCGAGGHNPMEPLRFGVPTWIGPGYDNFLDVVAGLSSSERLKVVQVSEVADRAKAFLSSAPRRADGMPDPALAPLLGATLRTLNLLRKVLPSQELAL